MNKIGIEVLLGKTLTQVKYDPQGADEIIFITSDKDKYRMYHSQGCCEQVLIEDIAGELEWLIGSPILRAEERSNSDTPKEEENDYTSESFTWTFYELATIKGAVTIRWYGSSNGYYSEEVDFEHIGKDE